MSLCTSPLFTHKRPWGTRLTPLRGTAGVFHCFHTPYIRWNTVETIFLTQLGRALFDTSITALSTLPCTATALHFIRDSFWGNNWCYQLPGEMITSWRAIQTALERSHQIWYDWSPRSSNLHSRLFFVCSEEVTQFFLWKPSDPSYLISPTSSPSQPCRSRDMHSSSKQP